LGGYTSCAGFVSTRGPVARKKKEKKSICLCRFSCRFVSHAKKNVINNDGKNVTEKFNAHGARALKLHRSCEKYAGFFLDFSHFALTAATGRTSFTTGPSGTFFTGLIIRDWTFCLRARRFNGKKLSDERGG
jgi:hypothetical protein